MIDTREFCLCKTTKHISMSQIQVNEFLISRIILDMQDVEISFDFVWEDDDWWDSVQNRGMFQESIKHEKSPTDM